MINVVSYNIIIATILAVTNIVFIITTIIRIIILVNWIWPLGVSTIIDPDHDYPPPHRINHKFLQNLRIFVLI